MQSGQDRRTACKQGIHSDVTTTLTWLTFTNYVPKKRTIFFRSPFRRFSQLHPLLPTDAYSTYLELQAEELQASLTKAGIDLSDADLEQFIKAMDRDGDGVIDYEEWRDFLVVSQSPVVFPSLLSLCLFCLSFLFSRHSLSIVWSHIFMQEDQRSQETRN